MTLGEALKHFRTAKGLTLDEVATRASSFEANLSRLERDQGHPSLDLLYRLAAVYEVSVSELFQFAENIKMDRNQAALNEIFSLLTPADRNLLLDFSHMLQTARGKVGQ